MIDAQPGEMLALLRCAADGAATALLGQHLDIPLRRDLVAPVDVVVILAPTERHMPRVAAVDRTHTTRVRASERTVSLHVTATIDAAPMADAQPTRNDWAVAPID
jgi:hypothetical protein